MGLRQVKLVCVSPDNNNKIYIMTELGDGTFKAEWGRIGGHMSSQIYSMNMWDKKYHDKLNKRGKESYTDQTHLMSVQVESNNSPYTSMKNKACQEFLEKLSAFAKHTVSENYTVLVDKVTQAQLNEAQKIVDDLAIKVQSNQTIDKDCFNSKLKILYRVIPRVMKDTRKFFMSSNSRDDAVKLVTDEQSRLDALSGQVVANNIVVERKAENKEAYTLEELLGIKITEVSDSEKEEILKKLATESKHYFRRAFKVENIATEKRYKDTLEKADNKTEFELWHGSKSENFFNILKTGLLIRPSNGTYNGSMLGDAIYGASRAKKSIGYTSLQGAHWTNGNDNVGFLAIFSFHMGNILDVHDDKDGASNMTYKKLKDKGYDSIHAHAGAHIGWTNLQNDEMTIYRPEQCTIRYIIEIGI